jgi:hypothetical protein
VTDVELRVALAPLDGAENVTVCPMSRLPLASATTATSEVVNCADVPVACGVPSSA